MSVYFSGCEKDEGGISDYELKLRNDNLYSDTLPFREKPHPYYLEIYKDLYALDLMTNFTDNFVSNLGIPDWENMIYYDSIPNHIYTITPIVDYNKGEVSGLLKAYRIGEKDFYQIIEKNKIIDRINDINNNFSNKELLNTDISLFHIFYWNIFHKEDPDYSNYINLINQIEILEQRNVIRVWIAVWVWEECCWSGENSSDCKSPPGGGNPGHWVLHYIPVYATVFDDGGIYVENNYGGVWGGEWIYKFDRWWNNNGNDSNKGNNSGGGSDSNNNRGLFFKHLDKIVRNIILRVTNNFINKNSINLSINQLINIIGIECYSISIDDDGVVEDMSDISLDEECALKKLCDYNLSTFEATYSLNLSQAEKDNILQNINVPCGGDQDEFDEEVKVLYLGIKLNLDDDEQTWLQNHQDVLDDIFSYQINNTYPNLNFNLIIYTLSKGGEIILKDYTDSYDAWGDLNNPPSNISKPEEIENGITIINTEIAQPTIYTNIFAQSPPRNNTEDLLSETDADDKGIALNPNLSDELYFIDMNLLFNLTTILDQEMEDIADGFVQQFKDNTGGVRHDPLLDAKIKEHPHMRNYIKRFGNILNGLLKETNGNIYAVSTPIPITDYRPKFDSEWDSYHGFKILMNDTEQTDIVLDSYNYNETTKEWEATFKFIVMDHFGLDKHDALTYQAYPGGSGFAAWWRLQHTRGYKPFVTKVWFKATIKGNLNN